MTLLSHSVRIASPGRDIVAVEGFAVAQNEITFLFGESGIGKSLVSKAIFGLLEEDGISVSINNQPYAAHLDSPRTRAVKDSGFFVFQEPSSHLNPLMKISRQLCEGKLAACKTRDRILADLWQTDNPRSLDGITDIYPKPFRPSGGEKQRILLAMAFQKVDMLPESAPSLFVFDEPTGSLDNAHRNAFLRLLFGRYARRPFTILIITHDYSMVSEVERSHQNLRGRIHYLEMQRRTEDRVAVSEFSEKKYLNWLRDAQKTAPLPAVEKPPPLLTVDSRFEIFGRALGLYEDPSCTRPADLEIRPGEMVYLKAASGAGKTTLAKALMGLLRPQKMRARLSDTTLTENTRLAVWEKRVWGKKAGMVFQHADEALNLKTTVAGTFAGLPGRRDLSGPSLWSHLGQLFADENPDTFLRKPVEQLSGGQKQRLNLLRALFLNTHLLILDEPLNGLDFESIRRVLSLLEQKRQNGTALLLISHNEEIFEHMVDPSCVRYLG